jgi:type 2 lantibiotic biosynthesis protein LanM
MTHVAPTPPAPQIPFEEALEPFVHAGWERLRRRTALAASLLAPDACEHLRTMLRLWLAAVSGKVLAHEFALYRLDRRSPLEQAFMADGEGVADLYGRFVRHLLGGDWRPFEAEYAEWARLRNIVIDDWIESSVELLERLARDGEAIRHRFAAGHATGRVAGLRPLSDDRHAGGRVIVGLAFENGTQLVYKPRPVGIEVWFGDLLRALDAGSGPVPELRTPVILDREDYGWCEYLPAHGCDSREGVARFFQRGGALLAVFHALGAVDCHLENLVAHGEHPVLVDAETILQGEPRRWRRPGPDEPDPSALHDSTGVIETGFLPNPFLAEGPDTSGLDGGRRPVPVDGVLLWQEINTDRMALREGTSSSQQAVNGVRLDGEIVDPRAHTADLTAGFDAMYGRLVDRRDALLDSALWARARSQRIRFLARSTSVYWRLALSSLEPRFMNDGAGRREELERLFAPLEHCTDPDRLRPLLEAEVEALARLDVPTFSVGAGDRDLKLASTTLPEFFEESGLARAERRLRALSPADRDRQHDLIARALA